MVVAWGRLVMGVLVVLAIPFLVFPFLGTSLQAQTQSRQTISTQDKFDVPDFNGSIHFATNGSYQSAIYSKGMWIFRNLTLGTSSRTANISLSVTNCDMTVVSFSTFNLPTGRVSLRYIVSGVGTQTVRFLDLQQQTKSFEWAVTVPSATNGTAWTSEGQNWELQANNTILVYGLVGNVSITRYLFGGSSIDANLPFPLQHSIAIVTVGVLIAVVAAAIVVKTTGRRK